MCLKLDFGSLNYNSTVRHNTLSQCWMCLKMDFGSMDYATIIWHSTSSSIKHVWNKAGKALRLFSRKLLQALVMPLVFHLPAKPDIQSPLLKNETFPMSFQGQYCAWIDCDSNGYFTIDVICNATLTSSSKLLKQMVTGLNERARFVVLLNILCSFQ